MIVDPVQVMGTASLGLSSAVAPIPSVLPDPKPIKHVDIQSSSETGERTLWVVFVIMTIAAVVFTGLGWNVPTSKRLFHIVTTFIVVFAALAYFAMAAGQGVSLHEVVYEKSQPHLAPVEHILKREVYWARYVDWSVTTPLLLLDLALIAGLSGADILVTIVADVIMVLTGLFAAFGEEGTPQKWGWYTIACIAFLVVIFQLAFHGRKTAAAKGGKIGKFFTAIGAFTLIIWTVYPIIWGIADGSRKMTVDQEIISYAILDILAKPIFGAWLLFTHSAIPETNIEIGGFWAQGMSGEGAIRVGDDEEGA